MTKLADLVPSDRYPAPNVIGMSWIADTRCGPTIATIGGIELAAQQCWISPTDRAIGFVPNGTMLVRLLDLKVPAAVWMELMDLIARWHAMHVSVDIEMGAGTSAVKQLTGVPEWFGYNAQDLKLAGEVMEIAQLEFCINHAQFWEYPGVPDDKD